MVKIILSSLSKAKYQKRRNINLIDAIGYQNLLAIEINRRDIKS